MQFSKTRSLLIVMILNSKFLFCAQLKNEIDPKKVEEIKTLINQWYKNNIKKLKTPQKYAICSALEHVKKNVEQKIPINQQAWNKIMAKFDQAEQQQIMNGIQSLMQIIVTKYFNQDDLQTLEERKNFLNESIEICKSKSKKGIKKLLKEKENIRPVN